MRTLIGAIVILGLLSGCDYNVHLETPTNPTPVPTVPTQKDIVEFRVSGDFPSAIVRVNNSIDGLTQIATVLPYTSQLAITGRDNVFLSLDARATGVGFLHVAIFVNGVIFREGSSASQFSPLVIVSGTYRRP